MLWKYFAVSELSASYSSDMIIQYIEYMHSTDILDQIINYSCFEEYEIHSFRIDKNPAFTQAL